MSNRVYFFAVASMLILSMSSKASEDGTGFYVGTGYGGIELNPSYWGFDDPKNMSLQLGYAISPGFSIEAQYSNTVSGGDNKFSAYMGTGYFLNTLISRNPGMTMEEAEELYPGSAGFGNVKAELSQETMALYGVAKTAGDLYVKAKAGFASTKQEYECGLESYQGNIVDAEGNVYQGELTPGDEEFANYTASYTAKWHDRETDFSLGVGAGYKFTSSLFTEIEFTRLNEDTEYYSVAVNYLF